VEAIRRVLLVVVVVLVVGVMVVGEMVNPRVDEPKIDTTVRNFVMHVMMLAGLV